MKTGLFNDNGGETYTETGNLIADKVRQFTDDLVVNANTLNVCLRDLQTLMFDELSVTCAEHRIRAGIRGRKIEREVINYQI